MSQSTGTLQDSKTTLAPGRKRASLTGTLYRGNTGMWSWVFHRISGVAIYFFLLVHVLDASLLIVAPEAYTSVIGTYKQPIMGIGEMFLVALVLFHALNGLRIIAIDFWSVGTKHHKALFTGVIVLWAILFLAFAIRHVPNVLHEFGWI